MKGPDRRRPMDPVDVLLHKQEIDPRRRSAITLVLELSAVPVWTELVARFEAALTGAPSLKQRLVAPLPGAGPPVWALDTEFLLSRHLGTVALPAPGDRDGLLAEVTRIATEPLRADRPLWRAVLVDGGPGGSSALVVCVSHVVADGLAGVQLLAGLVDGPARDAGDLSAGPTADTGSPPAPPSATELTALGLTLERWAALPIQMQARAARNAVSLLRAGADTVNHPRQSADRAVRYARSLRRVLDPGGAVGSPALRARSQDRRYFTMSVPVGELRRAARAAGGSLNDAYLAAVLGGLRRYHEQHGVDVEQIPFAIPISTRRRSDRAGNGRSDAAGGNRFAPFRFAAPIGIADPGARIRAVGEIIRAARAEPALDAMTTFAPVLSALPASVVALAGRAQDRLDAQASYVPGPPLPVRLAGTPVHAIYAFGPLPGPAVMCVLFTYAGTAHLAFTVDAAAVPDLDGFAETMRAGLDEVLEMGNGRAESEQV